MAHELAGDFAGSACSRRRGEDSAVFRREYDGRGRLLGVVDARGKRTEFEYADADVPVRISHAGGPVEELVYGANSIQRRIAGAPHSELRFDERGRLTAKLYADGHRVKFAFGETGKVERATSGSVISRRDYDGEGHLTLDETAGVAVRAVYAQGRPTRIELPDGASVSYEYNADGRLAAVVDWEGKRQEFRYGWTKRTVARVLPSGLCERSRYDDHERMRSIELGRSGEPLRLLQSYERDGWGRVVTRSDNRHGRHGFEYDVGGQLLAVRNQGEIVERFAYDVVGNRVFGSNQFVEYDDANRAVRTEVMRYRFDARGNRSASHAAGGVVEYIYDLADRLLCIVHPDGARTEYEYDAFSRRIEKRCGGRRTRYVWFGHQMVQESVELGSERRTREFLYWPEEQRPLAMHTAGCVHYYHCDHLGTPQLLTDASGEVTWSASYEAFGRARIDRRDVEQPLRFAGQYFDDESGLHYNRARYYDPALGCYLSADKASPEVSGNRYRYAAGNPINLTQPLGLFGCEAP